MNDIDIRGIGFTSQRTRDRLVKRLIAEGVEDERVLAVMAATPRHLFVDEALAHRAYEDSSLPIGHQQTISQPLVVARMTAALLRDGVPESVLEVGTGSGYQTAVLAQLVAQVCSVERIRPLLEQARTRLAALRLRNAVLRHADGTMGWPEKGPYDGILVAAAPRVLPAELLEQLAVGGRMVLPVGDGEVQELVLLHRTEDGIRRESLGRVRFVPLLGGVLR